MNPVRPRAIEQLRRLTLDAPGERYSAVYLFRAHARDEVRRAGGIDAVIPPMHPFAACCAEK